MPCVRCILRWVASPWTLQVCAPLWKPARSCSSLAHAYGCARLHLVPAPRPDATSVRRMMTAQARDRCARRWPVALPYRCARLVLLRKATGVRVLPHGIGLPLDPAFAGGFASALDGRQDRESLSPSLRYGMLSLSVHCESLVSHSGTLVPPAKRREATVTRQRRGAQLACGAKTRLWRG